MKRTEAKRIRFMRIVPLTANLNGICMVTIKETKSGKVKDEFYFDQGRDSFEFTHGYIHHYKQGKNTISHYLYKSYRFNPVVNTITMEGAKEHENGKGK